MHVMKHFHCVAMIIALAGGVGEASADSDSAGSIVLAPLASTGGGNSKTLRRLEAVIENGLSALPGATLVTAQDATKATRRAKRPELRTCDGNTACLTSLGKLVLAERVIYAEVSDLGDAQVIYMKAIDVATGKELRSTTLKLGKSSDKGRESKAAAAQLLTPNLYVGTLEVKTSVTGATVFLDGHKVATSPSNPISVYVGSHALRVTHPERSDYVRFVDIGFEANTVVDAELLGLPGLDRRLSAEGALGNDALTGNEIVQYRDRPWYFRWYTITGGIAAVAITSAVLASGSDSISWQGKHDL